MENFLVLKSVWHHHPSVHPRTHQDPAPVPPALSLLLANAEANTVNTFTHQSTSSSSSLVPFCFCPKRNPELTHSVVHIQPLGPDSTSNQGTQTQKKNQLNRTAPKPEALAMLQPRQKLPSCWGEAQLSQGSCSSPSGPLPNSTATTSIPRRNPSQLQFQPLQLPVLLSTKAVAAIIPWGKMQPLQTSDATHPPKLLGIHRLHRDILIQNF